jgi:competence protein ComEA
MACGTGYFAVWRLLVHNTGVHPNRERSLAIASEGMSSICSISLPMSAKSSNNPSGSSPRQPKWLLRRMDQLAVAGLTLAALVSLAGYWISHGGIQGRLIEIDRAPEQTARFAVDINAADWPELAELPGVGETLARRIVETRQAQGPFADHEDLRRVRGIGPRTLERLRQYLLPMAESDTVAAQ